MPYKNVLETDYASKAAQQSKRAPQWATCGYVPCADCNERFTDIKPPHLMQRMIDAGWRIEWRDQPVNVCPRHGTS